MHPPPHTHTLVYLYLARDPNHHLLLPRYPQPPPLLIQAEMKLLSLTTAYSALAGLANSQATPNYTSPLGVQVYNPSQLFNVSGPWSLMIKAGPTLYVSGTTPFV